MSTPQTVPTPTTPEGVASRLWELYLACCLAGVVVLVMIVEHDLPLTRRLAVAGLLLGMGVWYVLVGHPLLCGRAPRRIRGYVLQAGLFALFVPAVALIGTTAFILFALCPLTYMTMRMAHAHLAVVAFALTPAACFLVQTGDLRMASTMVLPIGLLIIAFSLIISVTIERSERLSAQRGELIEELASTRAELARLSREAGVADERQRLAGDIHDTVAQGLSSVVMLVEAADAALSTDLPAARRHLALAARTARENLAETRAIVGALTPAPLADATLAEALRRLGARFGAETGVAVTVEVDGADRRLPTAVEVVLLRAAQEGLTNAGKHAGAEHAALRLAFAADGVALEVRDDGCGFDPAAAGAGFGLPTMRGRVEQLGGVLSVHSAVGTGTTLRAEVSA